MKKHLSSIILIIIFLIGLSMLLYPSVSNYINEKNASTVIASYEAAVSSASEERIQAMFQKAHEYNTALVGNTSAIIEPNTVNGYDGILNPIGTGIMGYVNIPKIEVELPIYHGVDEGVLQIGAGHLQGTSLPVGGASTHCVLSGHRGLPSAKLFTHLDELETGDYFTITILNQLFTYQVDQIKIVLPTESEDLQITKGKDYCTLVTCTPYGINTHRLLVRGVRVENAAEAPSIYVANEAFCIDSMIVMPLFAAPMLLVLLIILLIKNIRFKLKQKKAAAKEGHGTHETT